MHILGTGYPLLYFESHFLPEESAFVNYVYKELFV